jgi:hypothetical protein
LLEPIADLWKHARSHVGAHRIAHLTLFAGEVLRKIEKIDGVERSARLHGPVLTL